MAMKELRPRSDVAGITVGLIVFFVGVALLMFVFVMAFKMFGDPTVLTKLASMPPSKGGPPMAEVMGALVSRTVALFVMLIASSLVASKGIQLYMAGR